MKKPLAVAGAVIVSFGLGMFLAGGVGGADSDDAAFPPIEIPAAAAQLWFPPAEQFDNEGEPLSDESFAELMAALDGAMTAEETLADFDTEADLHLWNFIRRLAVPEISDEQKEEVAAYLDALIEKHPDSRTTIEQRKMLLDSYAASMPRVPGFAGFVELFPAVDEMESFPTEGEPFEDAQVDYLLATLDATFGIPEAAANIKEEAGLPLWRFGNRIQRGLLSDEQTARIVAYLDELKLEHPDAAEEIGNSRFLVERLVVGKVAPNITGTDTDGNEFTLEEYRGKVVAVIFSGQWCGPCRGEYPYQRAMLDIYDEEDVALLGVNSDAVLDTIVKAKVREGLDYRTWWDGHGQPDADMVAAEGPIATRWNVTGWPTIYVIDDQGVIRHTDKRGGELIAAVDNLLMDKRMREYREQQEAAAAEAAEAATDGDGDEAEAEEDADADEPPPEGA